jgi:hypothetical protein
MKKYCLFGYGFVVDSVVVVELDVRQAGRVVDVCQLPSHPEHNAHFLKQLKKAQMQSVFLNTSMVNE